MRRATAPRLSSTALLPLAPMVARAVGSANKSPTTYASSGASCTMRTAPRSTSMLRDVGGVEVVGTRDDGQAERRGFQQIVPADGHAGCRRRTPHRRPHRTAAVRPSVSSR